MSSLKVILGTLAAATVAAFAQSTRADEVVTRETVYLGPNRGLLWSGIVAGGGPYLASVIVAGESSNTSDHALFIPVAGPWVDLSQRGGCPVSQSSCNTETLNKVLLVGDGVLQAVGTIAILAAFLSPERDSLRHRVATTPTLHITPTAGPTGSGLAVLGTF
jgi:hypothetical protein